MKYRPPKTLAPVPALLMVLFAGCDVSGTGLSGGQGAVDSGPSVARTPRPPERDAAAMVDLPGEGPALAPPPAGTAPDAATTDALVSDTAAADATADGPGPEAAAAAPPVVPTIDCPRGNQNLVLCLRFDQGLVNESGNQVNLDAQRVNLEPGLSPPGRAARLDAQSSLWVRMTGGAVNITIFTLEAWIKLDRLPAAPGQATVVDKQGRYTLYVAADGSVGCNAGGSTLRSGPGLVTAGKWVSLACTANQQSMGVWVAGQRRAQAPAGAGQPPTQGGLALGRSMTASNPQFSGLLDNVRLWDQVRSAALICAAALDCPAAGPE